MLSIQPTSLRRLRSALYYCSVCAFLALGGLSCGQRGPLYLPETGPDAANSQADEAQGQQAGTDAEATSPDQDEEYDEETP